MASIWDAERVPKGEVYTGATLQIQAFGNDSTSLEFVA